MTAPVAGLARAPGRAGHPAARRRRAGRRLRARRPHRFARVHLRPAAVRRRRPAPHRQGRRLGRRRGRRGRRQGLRPQRAGRDRRPGRPGLGRPHRPRRRLRGQRRGLHRSAARGQRRQRAARARSSARPGSTPAAPSASPSSRWARPSRSSSPSSCGDRRQSRGRRRPCCCCATARPGLEVYLLRRTKGMPFAGGMTAYPGGGVDPRDGDTEIAWAGPAPATVGRGLRLRRADGPRAGLRRRAGDVRGGRRPAGRRPAGRRTSSPDVSGDDWEEQRQALLTRDLSLTELLAGRGLALRSDLLRPFAHWITPPVEPRRYDTKFFVAALPVGQEARHVSGEADEADVADAVRGAGRAVRRGPADAAADDRTPSVSWSRSPTSPRRSPAPRRSRCTRSARRSRRRPTAAGRSSPTAPASGWSCRCRR